MNAVGRVGTYIAQGVYTVSGPFHPFGGAVDIIVVEQEDGTFKSSPWYVKFGKFQGVLKRTEKRVAVAVNDGDANFHMYLDHKGEAYFLKDLQGDEAGTATLSLTEATSSGDESSHTYARGEQGAAAGPEQGKEESEDDRGDDLELKLQGREASKQLIDALEREKLQATQPDAALGGEFRQENVLLPSSAVETSGAGADPEDLQHGDHKVLHTFSDTDGGLRKDRRPKSARDFFSHASYASHSVPYRPGFDFSEHGLTHAGKISSRNGMLIHCLLNLAVGRQPIDKSGTAVALVAKAALSSLKRVVSGQQVLDADVQSSVPQNQLKLADIDDGVSNLLEAPDNVVGKSNPGESAIRQEQDIVEDILSKAISGGDPRSHTGNSCNDVKAMIPVSSLTSLVELDADDRGDVKVTSPLLVGSSSENFDVSTTLEVRDVEIRDNAVVVKVQGHLEVEEHGQYVIEKEDVVETIVIDRAQLENEVLSRKDEDGGHVVGDGSQNPEELGEKMTPEECDADITVKVDKHVVGELKAGLEDVDDEEGRPFVATHGTATSWERSHVIGAEKDVPSAKDNPIPPSVQGSMIRGSPIELQGIPAVDLQGSGAVGIEGPLVLRTQGPPAVGIQGDVIKTEGVQSELSPEKTSLGELTLGRPMNAVNVSSPRQRAPGELETEWRHVVENAATLMKISPYSSKKFGHSPAHKKKSSNISRSNENEDATDEGLGQSERKSWGWLWGGSSAPQPKQGSDQDGSKDGKKNPSSVEGELRSASSEKKSNTGSLVPDSEMLTKRTESANQSLIELQKNQTEGEGRSSDSGADSGRKDGSEVLQSGKEDQMENNSNGQAQSQQQTKRGFFGLFGSRNSPSLSNASSPQRQDEQQQSVKGESAPENADIEDIFDQKWAKSRHANQGLSRKAPPPMEVPEAKLTEGAEDLRGNAESSTPSIAESVVEKDESTESEVKSGPSEDVGNSPNTYENRSSSGADSMTEATTPLADERDANSALSNRLSDQVDTTVADARSKNASDVQPEIGAGVNWQLQNQSDTFPSDTSFNGPKPVSNTEVVIISGDGCILAAPIDDKAEVEAIGEAHKEQSNPSFDSGENHIDAVKSPQRTVCFADPSEPVEEQVEGSDAKQLLSNGVHSPPPSDMERSDCTEILSATSGAEGLKQLAQVLESDDLEGDQVKIFSTNLENVQELVSTLESSKVLGEPADEVADGAGARAMETQTDEFASSNLADDGDTLESSGYGMERYFSSNDLTEVENQGSNRFRRNLSVYLDAVGDDNDEYAAEDEDSRAIAKTDPIEIPGAVGRARNYSSPGDAPALRTAESLPNARHGTLNSEMASPRLAMSRSLDSAPRSAQLTPDRIEVESSSIPLTAPSEGNLAAGPEKASKNSQSESKPIEADKLETQRQSRATGFELSLCRPLLKERMGLEAAAEAFASEKITLDVFKESGSVIAADDKLVVRVGDQYYPWVVASPIVLGILAFGQVLVSTDEGAIPVEKPAVTFDGKGPASPLTTATSSGWTFWPFGSGRRPKTPEKENVADSVSKDELALETALKTTVTKEYLQLANYYLRPAKVKTNTPSSQQLASLNLKEGSNKVTFTFVTRVWGRQQVGARIYLWKWNTRIVISDVDGTITKSDVLGQVMPLMGKDWTQSGVARLFSAIKKNGYELMFLSARAISQAHLTRQFLESIKQDGEVLPDGPVVISPDGLFPSLFREVIRRAPHEFKIACLQDIKSLFPAESKPFYAGFGNRDTDELSYLKVGIVKGKIFTINPKGEVVVNNRVDVKSYTSLHKLVDDMFPSMTGLEHYQEDYNDLNFWKLPLPDIEDELTVSSVNHFVPKKGVKSGKS